MKILLIGNEVDSKSAIRNYSDVQSFYLSRAFRNAGVSVSYFSERFSDPNHYGKTVLESFAETGADHIIALGVRFFSKLPPSVGIHISRSVTGLVCQIHDGSLLDGFPCDLNLTIRRDDWRYVGNENNRFMRHIRRNAFIGWGCDSEVFFPEQEAECFRVFIDHSTFVANSPDSTLNILMSLRELRDNFFRKKGQYLGFKELKIRMLLDEGVCDVDLDQIVVRPYNRTSIQMEELAKELRASHVFFVTHAESVGMGVLESAVAGAFVLAPERAINQDLLQQVRHAEFKGAVNWAGLTREHFDPNLNSEFARCNSWDRVAERVVDALIRMQPILAKKDYLAMQ